MKGTKYALSAALQATYDKYLTNVSRGLFAKDSDFLCESLLPEITVKQSTGKIGYYDKEHLRIVNDFMGGRGAAPRIEAGTVSSDNYNVEKHGLADLVTEEEYDNVDEPFDAENDKVTFLQNRLFLGKEYALASQMVSSSVLTKYSALTGTQKWSDYTNSSPLTDFATARASVWDNGRRAANHAIINYPTFMKLQYHPEILEYYKYVGAGPLSFEQVRSAMGVENLHIGMASYNSSDRGQTDSLTDMWGKHCIFYYAPKGATKYDQSLGFYVKRGARKVYKNKLGNPPEATEIIVIDSYDYIITDVNCGYLLQNVIA